MTVCAALPTNENDRLRALYCYHILDTPEEPAFDMLTRVAAAQLQMPISLISLVDANRQWFKSHFGLEARSTPRDVAFCGHTILEREPMIVPDAQRDARFADNPLVTGAPHVRFYAGAALVTPDGYPIGTICVIDRIAREFSAAQTQKLQTLAGQVMERLELHRVLHEARRGEAVAAVRGDLTAAAFRKRVLGWWRHVKRWLRHAEPYQYTYSVVMEYQQSLLATLARYDLKDAAQQRAALQACVPLLFAIREPATQVQFARDLIALYPQHTERAEELQQIVLQQVSAYGRGDTPRFPLPVLIERDIVI